MLTYSVEERWPILKDNYFGCVWPDELYKFHVLWLRLLNEVHVRVAKCLNIFKCKTEKQNLLEPIEEGRSRAC